MADAFVRLKKDETYYIISGNMAEWNCLIDFSTGQFRKTDNGIVVAGKLSKASGLRNYDNKDWKPEGQLIKLIFHNSTYKKWVKGDDGKPKTEDTEPTSMELFFYKEAEQFIKDYGDKNLASFKGFLKIDASSAPTYNYLMQGVKADGTSMSEETISFMKETLIGLAPTREPHYVPDSELDSLSVKDGNYGGKGGYKSVSEKERLMSRLEFCKEQFPGLLNAPEITLEELVAWEESAKGLDDEGSRYIRARVRRVFQILLGN